MGDTMDIIRGLLMGMVAITTMRIILIIIIRIHPIIGDLPIIHLDFL